MGTEHKQRDERIDNVLAALRAAVPPDGMQARIEARIAERVQQAASVAEFRWRDLLTGSTLAGAWGRGAVSGAAAAMLVAGLALFAGHLARVHPELGRSATREGTALRNPASAATPVAATSQNASASQALANPCTAPKVLRARSAAVRYSDRLRAQALAAVNAPSHPAPVLPLTAQEEALAELARTASPALLVSLTPDAQERSEAQDEAQFNKFFTPPPTPPQPEYSDPTITNPNQSQL